MANIKTAATSTPDRRKASQAYPGLATRLKALRKLAGVSQDAVGMQGFVSTPGWIKVENGQRSPSEKLLAAFVCWLAKEKAIRASAKTALIEELSALKYAAHRAPFLSQMAKDRLASLAPTPLEQPRSQGSESRNPNSSRAMKATTLLADS